MLVRLTVHAGSKTEDFGQEHPQVWAQTLAGMTADPAGVRIQLDNGPLMSVHEAIAFLQGMVQGEYGPEDVCECAPPELCHELGETGG